MSERKVKLLPLTAIQIKELEATALTLAHLSELSGKPTHRQQYLLITRMVSDLKYSSPEYTLPNGRAYGEVDEVVEKAKDVA